MEIWRSNPRQQMSGKLSCPEESFVEIDSTLKHVTSLSSAFLRTFAGKFSNIDFFLRLLPLKVDEFVMSEIRVKKWGSPTSFRRQQARKNTLNLKNRASLANKAQK